MDPAGRGAAAHAPPRGPRVRFPYSRIDVDPSYADPSGIVYRPAVPVTVYGLTDKFPLKGIVDTGATETILPAFLIDLVAAALRPGETGVLVGADGRPFLVTYGTIDLAVRLQRRTIRWHSKVAFQPKRQDALLGDAGFLRHFTVTLNGRERYTTLRPNGVFPPAIMPAK